MAKPGNGSQDHGLTGIGTPPIPTGSLPRDVMQWLLIIAWIAHIVRDTLAPC